MEKSGKGEERERKGSTFIKGKSCSICSEVIYSNCQHVISCWLINTELCVTHNSRCCLPKEHRTELGTVEKEQRKVCRGT